MNSSNRSEDIVAAIAITIIIAMGIFGTWYQSKKSLEYCPRDWWNIDVNLRDYGMTNRIEYGGVLRVTLFTTNRNVKLIYVKTEDNTDSFNRPYRFGIRDEPTNRTEGK